jgi:hypothetical protein
VAETLSAIFCDNQKDVEEKDQKLQYKARQFVYVCGKPGQEGMQRVCIERH